MSAPSPVRAGTALRYVVVSLVLAVALLPMLWVFVSSFKGTVELTTATPTLLPRELTTAHYGNLFDASNYGRYLRNSLVVATGTMVANVVLATLAGYSLHRLHFPGRAIFKYGIILVYVFPAIVLVVPIFRVMGSLGLVDNLGALVIMNVMFAAPFSVWLLGPFFDGVPSQVEEAAELDGAGHLTIMLRIVFPLILPGLATIAIFAFVSAWTEYTFASILMQSELSKTLPVGLGRFVSQYRVDWGIVSAGAAMTSLPVMALFAVIGRYFVNSVTGSIK